MEINLNADKKNYKKNLTNVLSEQSLRLLFSFVYTIILTKSIGVENYGQLSLVLSVTMLFSVLIHQGMEMVCIKKLVENKEDGELIISTAMAMQLIGALVSVVLIQVFVVLMGYKNYELYLISASVAMVGAMTCIKYDYSARVKSYILSRINTINYIGFLFIKLILVQYTSEVIYLLVMDLIAMIFLVTQYVSKSNFKIFQITRKANRQVALQILKSSKYVACSSLALIIFTRIDQIIISKYLGLTDNGIYAFTVGIVSAIYFIPTVISATFYPRLISACKDEKLLEKEMQRQLSLISFLSVIIVVISMVCYPFFIDIVMGKDYEKSKSLFFIMILAFVPVSLGVMSNKWYFVKNLESLLLRRTVGGAVIAIALSLLTIQDYGINGVAVSFLVSHLYSGVLANVISKKTRELFFLQLKSLCLIGLFRRC